MSVLGRASPLCSERYSRAGPRGTETNQGKPGSNWCSHSLRNPSRSYHETARDASSTYSTGTTSASTTLDVTEDALLLPLWSWQRDLDSAAQAHGLPVGTWRARRVSAK